MRFRGGFDLLPGERRVGRERGDAEGLGGVDGGGRVDADGFGGVGLRWDGEGREKEECGQYSAERAHEGFQQEYGGGGRIGKVRRTSDSRFPGGR